MFRHAVPSSPVPSPVAVGGSADGDSVWLGWNAPASGPIPIAYRVLRTASGGAEQEVARVGGNAHFDSNVQSGVTYTWRVQGESSSALTRELWALRLLLG